MQAGIGGEAGHAVYPQRGTQRQSGRVQAAPQCLGRQHCVGLPATRRQHQLTCGYALGVRLQHLGHGLALHHRAHRHRRGIRGALVHASTHVRVQRQVAVAQQHFAIPQCRQRSLFQAEVGRAWCALRTRGQHDTGGSEGIGHGDRLCRCQHQERNADTTPQRLPATAMKTAFHGPARRGSGAALALAALAIAAIC